MLIERWVLFRQVGSGGRPGVKRFKVLASRDENTTVFGMVFTVQKDIQATMNVQYLATSALQRSKHSFTKRTRLLTSPRYSLI